MLIRFCLATSRVFRNTGGRKSFLPSKKEKIDKLQEDLTKCKTENESLIFDLRECKTSLAFLEEKKAMLQIELAREKKKKFSKESASRSVISDDFADEEKNINLTVHS